MQEIITDTHQDFEAPQPPAPVAIERPTPNNPPWNGWAAIGLWVLSVLSIVILPLFFVIPYLVLSGKMFAEGVESDPTVILVSLIAIIPVHIFTLVGAWFIVTRRNRYSYRETLGWEWGGMRWWHFLMVFGIILACLAIVSNFFPEQDNHMLRMLRSSRNAVFVIAFLATFTAPIVEEVVYRGVLYSALQRRIGVTYTVFLVTALFAGVHFFQYWGSPGTLIMICLLSLILTLVRVRTGNLLPCIVLHTIVNGLQSLVLLFEPYLPEAARPFDTQSAIFHLLK